MKSRIEQKFIALKNKKQKAFTAFLTAGDPDLKTTETLIHRLDAEGVSIIELGMPFSDPMADGPVIQQSYERALQHDVSLTAILKLVSRVRKKSQVPILLMGYYNPVYQYGLTKFAKDAANAGVDGLLIVDLPPEEANPLQKALKGKGIDLIFLLTPTSTKKRIALVKKNGSGFVYYVSLTGITGASHWNAAKIKRHVAAIQKSIKTPLQVGFGISTPEHVKTFCAFADGVVVGSAFIKEMQKHKTKKAAIDQTAALARNLVRACS